MQRSVLMRTGRLRFQQSLMFLLMASYVLVSAQITRAEQEFVEFPIPPYDDVIAVPVTIGGTEHLCVVDSGANRNAFDKSLRDKLGKPLGRASATAANGERFEIETFAAPEATIGGLHVGTPRKTGLKQIQKVLGFAQKDNEVACFDFSPQKEASARNIEGIIGMPLFRNCIVQFDFDDRRMRILARSVTPSQDWGTAYKVSVSDRSLARIDIEVAGREETCIIDTGYTGTLALESQLFSTLINDKTIRVGDDTPFVQATGFHQVRTGRLSKVKLGEFESSDRRVFDGGKESRIGLTYLRQFQVTFDFPRQRLYLKKGKAFNKPDKEPAMGTGILLKNEKYVVESIDKDSAGERAGIERGDEIVTVNGGAIQGKSNGEIRSICRESMDIAGRVELTVRRDGVDRPIVLLDDKQ